MALRFEWDRKKAESNLKKHGVSFEEAMTVFGDALSLTITDEMHSAREQRWVLVGFSNRGRLVVVVHVERGNGIRIISAREAKPLKRGKLMKVGAMKKGKQSPRVAEMRAEYDFSGGERGKYAKRFAEGTNIIILDADVAELFPDSRTVNEALRALSKIADRQRKIAARSK